MSRIEFINRINKKIMHVDRMIERKIKSYAPAKAAIEAISNPVDPEIAPLLNTSETIVWASPPDIIHIANVKTNTNHGLDTLESNLETTQETDEKIPISTTELPEHSVNDAIDSVVNWINTGNTPNVTNGHEEIDNSKETKEVLIVEGIHQEKNVFIFDHKKAFIAD